MTKPPMLKRLKGSEKGLSLIELLLVIALTGIIGAVATMSISQVFTSAAISNDQNTAINQVRNAGHWISRDVQMAVPGTVNASPASPKFLSVEQEKWESGVANTHTVDYRLEDAGTDLKELRRYYDESATGTLIAQYIDPDNSDCQWDGEVLTMNITAKVGEKRETRTFQVKPRPDPVS